jgi:uridine kinase
VTLAERLARVIDHLHRDGRVLVAVDGPDAAGKTTLTRQLADAVQRPVVTASLDGWHNPRETRTRRGADSAEGCYLDSFDYDALCVRLLVPFRAGHDIVQTAGFDYRSDQPITAEAVGVPPTAALLLDGVFLQRPELRGRWDLTVYLHVPESVTLARAAQRDGDLFGDEKELLERYERRYLPAQRIYADDAAPMHNADIVVDNSDAYRPRVLRWLGE